METPIKNCTGIVLAGGENKRMPVLKSFIEVSGQSIIKRNIALFREIFTKTYIVTNQPEHYCQLGLPMLGDTYDIRGPATGVFTALLNADTPWVFISACDMPFISTQLIRFMASTRQRTDAVIPSLDNNAEPLFAFYSRRLLKNLEKTVLSENRSLKDFLRDKRVEYITTPLIKRHDPDGASFVNLNSPGDIEQYLPAEDQKLFRRNVHRRIKCLV